MLRNYYRIDKRLRAHKELHQLVHRAVRNSTYTTDVDATGGVTHIYQLEVSGVRVDVHVIYECIWGKETGDRIGCNEQKPCYLCELSKDDNVHITYSPQAYELIVPVITLSLLNINPCLGIVLISRYVADVIYTLDDDNLWQDMNEA